MRNSTTLAAVSVAAAAGTLIPYMVWRKRASETPLPPSPSAYPLIGNLLDMPSKEEYLGFIEIGKSLGSNIFSLNMFGNVIIVLNSAEDAINLLEKRSSIYSDRGHFPMLAEPSLMDWGNLVSALGYGERWRKSRRIMHQWLHKQAAEAFHPSQQLQARILLRRLLNKANHLDLSKELELEAYRAMAGTIVHSVYGLKIDDSNETFILKLKETVDNLAKAALPSNFLTVAAILVFFVAMLLFPEVQKKAHEEIDTAVGSERLPTMDDRAHLPYVERLIQEVLRWRPIFPNGLPHVCYQDDIYKGYRIPKGAKIFANIWAISRNPEVYKDPEVFDPDRFLDPSVPPSPTFGFGRRLCPGIHYAGSSLFIFIVSILAAFNIEMAKDEQGNSVVPGPEGELKTVIFQPVPFKLRLTPRSAIVEQLIQAGV
ncbi:hypothetical protein FS749_008790 [Ceratobasidium sp. UAMH 11750]|nr:hypothetical protein FS749_008790 [Ceratobasidium sp. UAMH 11750]